MQLRFSKMHSQGQDFIITEFVRNAGYIRPATATKLLHRISGIGADFLVLLEHPQRPDDDFHCRLFDAQGMETAIHYGAARCAARYASEQYLTGKEHLQLGFTQGSVKVKLHPQRHVSVQLSEPLLEPALMQLPLERFKAEYDLLIPELGPMPMGIVKLPEHCVQATVRVDDLQQIEVQHWGQAIVNSEHFPVPACVNFVQAIDEQRMHLQCYSNTAQGYDAQVACAVISAQLKGWQANPVDVLMHNGTYQVHWSQQQSVFVSAPVATAFDGRVFI